MTICVVCGCRIYTAAIHMTIMFEDNSFFCCDHLHGSEALEVATGGASGGNCERSTKDSIPASLHDTPKYCTVRIKKHYFLGQFIYCCIMEYRGFHNLGVFIVHKRMQIYSGPDDHISGVSIR